jgi:retron-type reverse transcriptase
MHCDVRQYFPSIDHQILRLILVRTIGDRDVMGLIDKILASGVGVQAEEYNMMYFPGDDLFAVSRSRGLPIGNLASQHWANVYLNEPDQYAKRVLKCRAYIRFVDDILLFSQHKKQLQEWRQATIWYLQRLRLTLHENCAQPRPVETGVPFLGFVVFPGHRRLKRRNGIAFQRRLKPLARDCRSGELDWEKLDASLLGWINHARYGDTWGLRKAILNSAGLSLEPLYHE